MQQLLNVYKYNQLTLEILPWKCLRVWSTSPTGYTLIFAVPGSDSPLTQKKRLGDRLNHRQMLVLKTKITSLSRV